MADKGIIFSAPMVRALLEGRKTQTRRLLKHGDHFPNSCVLHDGMAILRNSHTGIRQDVKLPYSPGDRLYVREAFRLDTFYDSRKPTACPPEGAVWYEAGGKVGDGVPGKLHPSIHLPRWASRLWLAVTDVRVQQLQDIGEADCIAEGPRIKGYAEFGRGQPSSLDGVMVHTDQDNVFATPRCWYRELWDSLHNKPGERWDDNPWIVAVSFDVHRGNIDG